MPRYRLTCTGVAPSSDAGLPLIPGREIPLSRRTGTPCPRGEHPFSEGRGCPFSQERVPPTRGRLPLLRERAYLFRWTADPFPRDVYPITDERVPSSEGRGLHFRGTFVPRLGGTGTPYPTDGHPFSEGGGHCRRKGAVIRVTQTLFRGTHAHSSERRVPLFRGMGALLPMDGYPFPRGLVHLCPMDGDPFPRAGEPLLRGVSARKSFLRQEDDVPLEKSFSSICRRQSRRHGLDPLASIRETTFVLLPRTGLTSVCCSWCGGAWHAASSRLSLVDVD